MTSNDCFRSRFFTPAEFDFNLMLVIDRVSAGPVEGHEAPKPVLTFQDIDDVFILTKESAALLAAAYGSDTRNWEGQRVVMYRALTELSGEVVECLRLRAPNSSEPTCREECLAPPGGIPFP